MAEGVGEASTGQDLTLRLCPLDDFWTVDDRLASPKTFEVRILVQEDCGAKHFLILESWHVEQYDSGCWLIAVSIW
jgi:hypothetical protein